MAANDLSFNQLSTVLAEITSQATGAKASAPINTMDFVTVGTTALKTGYDPLATAISQVLSKTIFSIRPYTRKFAGLQVSNQKWGNIVRKLNVIDKPFEDDQRFTLADGAAIDQYIVNKPEVLQTNFYGANVYEKSMTIFRDQLDNAFSGPDQFAQFLTMIMTNASDMIEQAHENTARACITNFIAGKISGDSTNVLHLLTLYNAATGQELTAAQVRLPANWSTFVRWLYSYIKTTAEKMGERTYNYHINVTGKNIARHTPLSRMKAYIYRPFINEAEATVLSTTFHTDFLRLVDYEGVNFWQAINSPDEIKIKPSFMNADGAVVQPSTPIKKTNVLGVLFDEEAAGYTVLNEWAQPTPFNARGGYYNQFWHFTDRYWNDFTENGVVLLLD